MTQARILIVEDDTDLAQAMRLVLEANEYEVITACTKEQGLRKVEEEKPRLIILDVMMEDYTDGFHFSCQLRNPDPKYAYVRYAKTPILMLTAIGARKRISSEEGQDFLPVDDYIETPVQPSVLLKKIEELLKEA